MKELLRGLYDRLERAFLAGLPTAYAASGTRILRGRYAADNFDMYLRAAKWLSLNHVKGDVFEFGVGAGGSSCHLYHALRRHDDGESRRFFLFDSFKGLPKGDDRDAHPQWTEGAWAYSMDRVAARLRRFGVSLENVEMIEGVYEESLSTNLGTRLADRAAAIIHIDCDLYSSTEAALRFMSQHIQRGTIVLLDDYYCYSGDPSRGEAGAFHAWAEDCNILTNRWFPYSYHGQAFILTPKD